MVGSSSGSGGGGDVEVDGGSMLAKNLFVSLIKGNCEKVDHLFQTAGIG